MVGRSRVLRVGRPVGWGLRRGRAARRRSGPWAAPSFPLPQPGACWLLTRCSEAGRSLQFWRWLGFALAKACSFDDSRTVWMQGGGGRRVDLGRIARLGCGQADMAARAAWMRVVGGVRLRWRDWYTGVHHLSSLCTGRRWQRPWTSYPPCRLRRGAPSPFRLLRVKT